MEKTQPDGRDRTAATSLRAGMEEKAAGAVPDGAHWLTAQTVGERRGSEFARDTADRWQAEGKVFAIQWAGETFYPGYVFDAQGNPIPEVKAILKVFEGYRPFRNASWSSRRTACCEASVLAKFWRRPPRQCWRLRGITRQEHCMGSPLGRLANSGSTIPSAFAEMRRGRCTRCIPRLEGQNGHPATSH
ncbi:hypothetical protein LMG27177_04995 [Paraburkholderia fynbosensis]|uniref:Uncharacterized protein n=1 Tax=Paraburkholderia fynbosensis TaxID=1200993 RepID=A0A6J5GHW2_9BURK|nr:hypothetical protein LMG27177_04995 [Paraburkholderia fynbosensis]